MRCFVLLFFLVFSSASSADMFKCKQGGKTVYSESPCGDDSVTVQPRYTGSLDPVPRPLPNFVPDPQVVYVDPPQVSTVSREPDIADCQPFEVELARVRKKLREGYTISEDKYLHDRQRELIAALHSCIRR